MPVDAVSMLVAGQIQSRWQSYRIDSDLLIPADGWEVSLSNTGQALPASVIPGATAVVMVGSDVILTGLVDDIDEPVMVGQRDIMLTGRDYAGVLIDCSAPIFTRRQIGLEQVVTDVAAPLGIANVVIQTDQTTSIFEKVSVEPGESAWDIIQRVAEANGLWPWMAPDGTLIIGGANYSSPVVADLVLRTSGTGNNIKMLNRHRSIVGRYSDITILGQSHGTEINDGQNAIMAKATDPSLANYRPRIIIDSESTTQALAKARANKILSDGRLNGLDLTATVKGHRITPGGLLWTPGQRIHVLSEPHSVNAIYYRMGRTFSRDLQNGTITTLRLKEDGVWTLAAFPDKRTAQVSNGVNDQYGAVSS